MVLGVGHRAVAGQARALSPEHRGVQGGADRQTDAAPYHLPKSRTVPRGGQVGMRGQSPGSAGQGGRSLSPVMGAGLWAGETGTCSPAALMEAVRSVPLPASLGGLVLPCEMGSGPSQCWVCSGHGSGCFPGLKCARRHTGISLCFSGQQTACCLLCLARRALELLEGGSTMPPSLPLSARSLQPRDPRQVSAGCSSRAPPG